MIEAAMVSTTEGFFDNIPMPFGQYVTVKKPSTSKSLNQYIEALYAKPRTALRQLCVAKSKRKTIISGSMLWSSVPKQCSHTIINECLKKCRYILHHAQVVQSPIANEYLKLSLDEQAVPHLLKKLLLQVSVKELHNIMASPYVKW